MGEVHLMSDCLGISEIAILLEDVKQHQHTEMNVEGPLYIPGLPERTSGELIGKIEMLMILCLYISMLSMLTESLLPVPRLICGSQMAKAIISYKGKIDPNGISMVVSRLMTMVSLMWQR